MRTAVLVMCVVLGAGPARAEGPTTAEFTQLQREVRELRQMLVQAIHAEQQRYDLLLKLLQTGGAGSSALAVPSRVPGPAPAPAPAPASVRVARAATVSGTIELRGAASGQPVYVFVENVRMPPVRGGSLEIQQRDKQFSPQISVVQRGTSVRFPNVDRLTHNVFSVSGKNPFDLGMLKAGEGGRPVPLTEPGVVEVYCNIHSEMWAQVLVVPNGLYTKADRDGRFRLRDVPTGERVLVAWTAHGTPARQTVTVGPEGAEANLTVTVDRRRAHNNKLGQPYGSYTQ